MGTLENLRGGLSEIWGHKLRSALTLVGVILGVFSINCMFSIVQGVRDTIGDVFETIGFDGIVFLVPEDIERDKRTAWNLASKGLQASDADALRIKLADQRVRVSPLSQMWRTIEYNGKRTSIRIEACNEEYLQMRRMKVEKGRTLLASDVAGNLPVAVIGPQIAKDLFFPEDPIGKEIPLDGIRFTVIGVLKKSELPAGMGGGGGGGDMFGQNTVYIPISTARAYIVGVRTPIGIAMKMPKDGDFKKIADSAEMLIVSRHRGVLDFQVENVAEDMLREREEVDKMLGNFNVVLGCIAGTALLVGGIGILSVMLIAVNERLFEIGIRKAVGATDNEILFQFLVEASTLSTMGAVLGTVAAVVAVGLLGQFFPLGLAVSMGGLSLSAGFAVGIGLGFGLYPAWLASRMDPVESLRAT